IARVRRHCHVDSGQVGDHSARGRSDHHGVIAVPSPVYPGGIDGGAVGWAGESHVGSVHGAELASVEGLRRLHVVGVSTLAEGLRGTAVEAFAYPKLQLRSRIHVQRHGGTSLAHSNFERLPPAVWTGNGRDTVTGLPAVYETPDECPLVLPEHLL